MDEIKLNIDSSFSENPTSASNLITRFENSLSSMNEFEISKVVALLGNQGRPLVIPIGFPGAGKSLLLSSLFWYGQLGTDSSFKILQRGDSDGKQEGDQFFFTGKRIISNMVNYFSAGKLYERNRVGTMDLIGVDLIPEKFDKSPDKFPILPLSFLDLSGEDLKNIKTSEGGEFNSKINALFKGVNLNGAPLIFLLITPFEPIKSKDASANDAHQNDDMLHYDFLNYIETNQPEMLANSLFVIVVSQWDKNRKYESAEDFIKEKRPSVYKFVKNTNVVWGHYSIGKILSNKVNGIDMEEILMRSEDHPSKLWKILYKICTNRDLDYKSFWEKLFT